MKTKNRFIKYISFLLVLSIITTTISGIGIFASDTASAENQSLQENDANFTTETWEPDLKDQMYVNTKGDLTPEQLKSAVLAEEDIPEALLEEGLEENQHVNRLYEQETDLNTAIFQNKDGTKTLYSFDKPIKYVDKDGKIKDKSSRLSEVGKGNKGSGKYKYVNDKNNVKTYFPETLNDTTGIALEHDDVNIEMYPLAAKSDRVKPNKAKEGKVNKKQVKDKGNRKKDVVDYDGIFGEDTSIRYTPTTDGFKEDIILSRYTGVNSFSFTVKTNGLGLVIIDGVCNFIDPLTGEPAGAIEDILAYDSNGKEVVGNLQIETVKADSEYILTVSVSEEFLLAEDTVYPVYVDPSIITIGASGIEDATLFFNSIDENTGSSQALYVGNYNKLVSGSSKGTARAVMRFPGLASNSTFKSITNDQLVSVKVYLRDLMCEDEPNNIGIYRISKAWQESTVSCGKIWNHHTGSSTNTKTVQYNKGTQSDGTGTGHWYGFNITSIAKEWKNGSYGGLTNHYGVMLKPDNDTLKARTFGSSERSSNNPFVEVTYNAYVAPTQVSLNASSMSLKVGETNKLYACIKPDNATYKEIGYSTGDPSIATVDNNGNIKGIANGTVTIKAYSKEKTTVYASCTVTVTTSVASISISNYNNRYVGDSFYLDYMVYPREASDKRLTYSSSNSDVVTVDSNGKVFVAGLGEATITVRSVSNNSVFTNCKMKIERPQLKSYEITFNDSIFIYQLTNPDAAFNKPGSKYPFTFEKAYNLLQVLNKDGDITGKKLEEMGLVEPGQGNVSQAFIMNIYSYSRIGWTLLDGARLLQAKYESDLILALSFMTYEKIFNKNQIVIKDDTFSEDNLHDMLEKNMYKSGVTFSTKHGSLTAYKSFETMKIAELPKHVQDIYSKYNKAGWKGNVSGQTPKTGAGGDWENKYKQLPVYDDDDNLLEYKEFDVNNYDATIGHRDGERFVYCITDGTVYYTDTHYGDNPDSPLGIPPFVKIK